MTALDVPTLAPEDITAPVRSSWAAVDLGAARTDDSEPERPRWLTRTDGTPVVYPGRVHWLSGESESCKSWIAFHGAAQVLDAGGRVLVVDFEDDDRGFRERLDALGVAAEVVDDPDRVRYLRPEEPLDGGTDGAVADWLDALTWGPTFAVLDGVTAGMDLEGWDPLKNNEVARWLRRIVRPVANTGAAVVVIDHVNKDRENRGRYAIGAVHKLNAVDGASFTVEAVRPIGRALGTDPVEGLVKIKLAKDRRGWLRGLVGEGPIADVHLTAYPDGGLSITLAPPGRGHLGEHERRVADHLWRYDGASKRDLRSLGNSDTVEGALASMIDRGEVDVRKEGNAHRHYLTETGRNTWPAPSEDEGDQ